MSSLSQLLTTDSSIDVKSLSVTSSSSSLPVLLQNKTLLQSKCLTEKRRREQENIYIDELAVLSNDNLSEEVNSIYMKPEKSAVLQHTVNKIKSIKNEKCPSSSSLVTNEDVQQAQVSSTRPALINTEHLGCVLLEAVNGFLLVINETGRIEYVSENVKSYIRFTQEELIGQQIYNIVYAADHHHFQNALSLLNSSSAINSMIKREGSSFTCFMNTKSHIGSQNKLLSMTILAVVQSYDQLKDSPSQQNSEQTCLVCIAKRSSDDLNAVSSPGQLINKNSCATFITKQDSKGIIKNMEDLNMKNSANLSYPEMIGHDIKDFCLPADQPLLVRHFEKLRTELTDQSNIYRFRFNDSRYAFVRTRSRRFSGFTMSEHTVVRECEGDNELKNSAGTALMKSLVSSSGSNVTRDQPNSVNSNIFRPKSTSTASLPLLGGGSVTTMESPNTNQSLSSLLNSVGDTSEVNFADVFNSFSTTTTSTTLNTPPTTVTSSPLSPTDLLNLTSSPQETELQIILKDSSKSYKPATLDQYKKLQENNKFFNSANVKLLTSSSPDVRLYNNSKLRNLLQDDDISNNQKSVSNSNTNFSDQQCPDSSTSKLGSNYILKKLLSENDKTIPTSTMFTSIPSGSTVEDKEEKNVILKTLLNDKDDSNIEKVVDKKSPPKTLLKDILKNDEFQDFKISSKKRRPSSLSQDEEVQSSFTTQTLNIENVFSGPPTPATPFNDRRTPIDFLNNFLDDDQSSFSGPPPKRHKSADSCTSFNSTTVSRGKNLREKNQLLTKLLSKDTSKEPLINTSCINPAATPSIHAARDRIMDVTVTKVLSQENDKLNNVIPMDNNNSLGFSDDLLLQQVLNDATEMSREYNSFQVQQNEDEIISQIEQLISCNPEFLQSFNSSNEHRSPSEQLAINKIQQDLIQESNKHEENIQSSTSSSIQHHYPQHQQVSMILHPTILSSQSKNVIQVRPTQQSSQFIPQGGGSNVRQKLMLQSNQKKIRDYQLQTHNNNNNNNNLGKNISTFKQFKIGNMQQKSNIIDGQSLLNLNEMMNTVAPNVSLPRPNQQTLSSSKKLNHWDQPIMNYSTVCTSSPAQPAYSSYSNSWSDQQIKFAQKDTSDNILKNLVSQPCSSSFNLIGNMKNSPNKSTYVKQELRNLCTRKQTLNLNSVDTKVSLPSSELPDDIANLLNDVLDSHQQTTPITTVNYTNNNIISSSVKMYSTNPIIVKKPIPERNFDRKKINDYSSEINDLLCGAPTMATLNEIKLKGNKNQLSQPLLPLSNTSNNFRSNQELMTSKISLKDSDQKSGCNTIPKGEQGPHSLLQKLLSD